MVTSLNEAFYGFDNYPPAADLARAAKKFQGFSPIQIVNAAKEEINSVGGNDAINVIFEMCKRHIAAAFHKYYLGPDKSKGIKKAKDASGDKGPEAAYIQSIVVMLKSKKANPILAFDTAMYETEDDPFGINPAHEGSYDVYIYNKWIKSLSKPDQKFVEIVSNSNSYSEIFNNIKQAFPQMPLSDEQLEKHLDNLTAKYKQIRDKDFWEKLGFYVMRYAQSDVFKNIRRDKKPDQGQMSLDAPVGEDGQGTDVAQVDPAQGTFNATEDMREWIDSLPDKTPVQARDKMIMRLKFMGYPNDKIVRGMTKNGYFTSEETGRVLLSQRLKFLNQEFLDYYAD